MRCRKNPQSTIYFKFNVIYYSFTKDDLTVTIPLQHYTKISNVHWVGIPKEQKYQLFALSLEVGQLWMNKNYSKKDVFVGDLACSPWVKLCSKSAFPQTWLWHVQIELFITNSLFAQPFCANNEQFRREIVSFQSDLTVSNPEWYRPSLLILFLQHLTAMFTNLH